jgi:hypothetical protein
MNWPRLFFQKEQFGTVGYKKVEWTAALVEAEGARTDSGFAKGGRVVKVGTGRCELESFGAFAPDAHGELRVSTREFDFWSEFSNDKAAFGAGEDNLRIRLDEPSITVDGKTEIVFEKPRGGKHAFLLLGASQGDAFLGYLPASLRPGGLLSFVFGTSVLTPWFVPAAAPWGGRKLIEAKSAPPEMGGALGDEAAWKAFEERAGGLFQPILAARILFCAAQFVRFG